VPVQKRPNIVHKETYELCCYRDCICQTSARKIIHVYVCGWVSICCQSARELYTCCESAHACMLSVSTCCHLHLHPCIHMHPCKDTCMHPCTNIHLYLTSAHWEIRSVSSTPASMYPHTCLYRYMHAFMYQHTSISHLSTLGITISKDAPYTVLGVHSLMDKFGIYQGEHSRCMLTCEYLCPQFALACKGRRVRAGKAACK
jgi:hypothetical protein